jgi:hypothetical protein
MQDSDPSSRGECGQQAEPGLAAMSRQRHDWPSYGHRRRTAQRGGGELNERRLFAAMFVAGVLAAAVAAVALRSVGDHRPAIHTRPDRPDTIRLASRAAAGVGDPARRDAAASATPSLGSRQPVGAIAVAAVGALAVAPAGAIDLRVDLTDVRPPSPAAMPQRARREAAAERARHHATPHLAGRHAARPHRRVAIVVVRGSQPPRLEPVARRAAGGPRIVRLGQ